MKVWKGMKKNKMVMVGNKFKFKYSGKQKSRG